jgi:succinate dehydrogenase/fumarate reductase flavoprotein subunit
MVLDIGGAGIDLEKVQVHPTGLVDPNEPDAKVKFLAAEALRGVGGLLLDSEGNRFADELGHRDYVTVSCRSSGVSSRQRRTLIRFVVSFRTGTYVGEQQIPRQARVERCRKQGD